MKYVFRRFISIGMAICITLSLGVAAMAATAAATAAPVPYVINVTSNKQVQFMKNGATLATFNATATDLVLRKSADNNALQVTFPVSGKRKVIQIGEQASVQFTGSMNSLTLENTIPKTVLVTLSGAADTFTVDAPVAVSVASGADVGALKVSSTLAAVTVDKNAKVAKAYAAVSGTITGAVQIFGLTSSASTVKTTPGAINTKNTQGKIATILDVDYKDDEEKTYSNGTTKTIEYVEGSKNINWTGEYTVEIEAKSGSTLGRCMRDLILTVYRADDTDKKIAGSWAWVTGNAGTTAGGTYHYRFTPNDTKNVNPITITVIFTGNGSTTSMTKPSISFASGQRSHGEAGVNVEVEVKIPKQVQDEDELTIYLDNKEVDYYELDESDAGDTYSYFVEIPSTVKGKTVKSGDKFKIKAKIKRAINNRSVTSSTITYTIDD